MADVAGGFPRTIHASCHCGAVRVRALARSRRVLACNCSMCTRKGFLHIIVEPGELQLLTPPDALVTYTFGTHTAQHLFCRVCGIGPHYVPRSHPDGHSVNLRCVEGVAFDDWDIEEFDGRNWEQNVEQIR